MLVCVLFLYELYGTVYVCLASTMLDSRVCVSSKRQVEDYAGLCWFLMVEVCKCSARPYGSIVLGGWYLLTVALLLPPLLTLSICLFPPLFLTHSTKFLHSALLETIISLLKRHHDTFTYIPNKRIMQCQLAGVKAGRCMFSLDLLTEALAD